MEPLLKDRVSIITGGAIGIGKEIARIFALEGSKVAIVDNDLNSATATTEKIKKISGRETMAVKAEVDDAVKKVIEKFENIDILVNNAGVYKAVPLLEFTEELWDWIIDINLKGTFLFTLAVAKEMAPWGYGKIINISSCSGIHPNPGETAYGASKAGILSLTRDNAFELGK